MSIDDFKPGQIAYLTAGRYNDAAIIFITQQVENVDDLSGLHGASTHLSTSQIISSQWQEVDEATAREIYKTLHRNNEFPKEFAK